MGCCQDKDFKNSDEATKEAESGEGGAKKPKAGGKGRAWLPVTGLPHGIARGGWNGDWRGFRPHQLLGTERTDVSEKQNHVRPKSNESFLITVLWRRLSMFSRRGSSRPTQRTSVQSQMRGSACPDNTPLEIQEEPEKG
ncbi:LOW QUALITY PROTEIN: testis-expressed protein 54 [Rhynchocyon petersi]